MSKHFRIVSLVLALAGCGLALAGCRTAYYAAWEKFGVHKRDLLKKRVVAARDEQKAASGEFKDALTRLKEMYAFDGGQLEKTYNALNSEYEQCRGRADAVHKRVRDVETVANDLFGEWDGEIKQMQNAQLAQNSRQQLTTTRQRYEEMHRHLKEAEQALDPVLTQFRDHVLYIKHNLNAQAISSLRGEASNIQSEISRLITQMNNSIARADEFIKTLP